MSRRQAGVRQEGVLVSEEAPLGPPSYGVTRKNDGMEPKQKQYPAAAVTCDRSKVSTRRVPPRGTPRVPSS